MEYKPDLYSKRSAMLLMVVTACLWSIGGIFVKLISWSPFLIAGVRSLISGGIMAGYMRWQGISYVLYAIASKDCPPLACSLIGMLEPLLNPVWVAIFVGEMPGMFALAGACVIIATVSWWCVEENRRADWALDQTSK